MVSKCIAFLATGLLLANCCALGNGCAPQAGAPVAWDGLGTSPTEDTKPAEPSSKQHARAKPPMAGAATEPDSKVQSKGSWDQQQAADQAEEARLKRKLMICSTCL